ncbi:NIPSNAP family protein [Klebsiella grimontii]|uniref:NIPSNAP family protein n=1 Tax=Klebsiella grimontii TaxID=2058152 RepID=UPI0012AC1507|nr:NIPSNAP family protein [Klebsiella grimontii]MBZ7513091.1 NIPSNAP family protein [Klebsiella grimontii]MDD9673201.1 NIPSNAP family protein [Klebsiella grimontii]MDD9679066.1 NIPSNAP family protein [Klebsiella grimontii]MDD9688609.1 NIPSNAP family protein [Klebsiella grimontii]MDD9698772.1 NIPSNAP family protein [Klebsiella grimontii]
MKTVEFLLYTLKPGSGNDFHRIMKEQSAPCHRAAGMDIVAFGNSVEDNDAYYLIRAYDDLTHLNTSQERFYRSPAWREGPRQAIIDKISVSVKTVMELGDSAIDGLRNS